ncbi:MAG: hypothetical protein II333_09740, partial [Clostridia bacterium]|nr:hypothetical protein [Clostridia bacterium]
EEQVDSIIDAHTETVEGLKDQVEQYKSDAEKLPGVTRERDDLRAAQGSDEWKTKYDKEHSDFEAYKADVTKKETLARKKRAYLKFLLDKVGISEKRVDTVMRVTDFDDVELDGDQVKDAEKRAGELKTEWADFVVTTTTTGTNPPNPPAGDTGDVDLGTLSMEDYIKERMK